MSVPNPYDLPAIRKEAAAQARLAKSIVRPYERRIAELEHSVELRRLAGQNWERQRGELDARTLSGLAQIIRRDNERWWTDLDTGLPCQRNVGEMIALMHSELSEALEGHRKDLMDDHLPHRKMFSVELADAVIRILDTAAHLCPDFEEILLEKLEYNRKRADHKPENRRQVNGKKY